MLAMAAKLLWAMRWPTCWPVRAGVFIESSTNNDAGAQIQNLALSVQARVRGLGPEDPSFPADGYRGQYIEDIAQAYLRQETVRAMTASRWLPRGTPMTWRPFVSLR